MLEQAREPTAAPDESEGEHREETDTGEKVRSIVTIRPKQQLQTPQTAEIVPGSSFSLYGKCFSLLKLEPLIIMR